MIFHRSRSHNGLFVFQFWLPLIVGFLGPLQLSGQTPPQVKPYDFASFQGGAYKWGTGYSVPESFESAVGTGAQLTTLKRIEITKFMIMPTEKNWGS
jgi:hypothetical protein